VSDRLAFPLDTFARTDTSGEDTGHPGAGDIGQEGSHAAAETFGWEEAASLATLSLVLVTFSGFGFAGLYGFMWLRPGQRSLNVEARRLPQAPTLVGWRCPDCGQDGRAHLLPGDATEIACVCGLTLQLATDPGDLERRS
jgi:hypothetical protein